MRVAARSSRWATVKSLGEALDYRPDIDGLRAVAVILVLLHHVWPKGLTGGFIGVDVFFVISGYLITRIVAAQTVDGTFRFRDFYLRRARRLLPALLAMLIAVLAAGWFLLLPSDYAETLQASLATTLISSNFVFWKVLALGYFAPDATLNPLLHTWSLGVEEQFYLVFPLALLLSIRFLPGKLKPLVVTGAIASLVVSIGLLGGHSVAVFYMAPFRAWEFLAGAVLAIGVVPPIASRTARLASVHAGLAAIVVAACLYSPATAFPGSAALMPVFGAMAVIHGGGDAAGRSAHGMLTAAPVVYIGRISYSLYLWHWPLVTFVKYVFAVEAGFWLGCGLVAASIVMGGLSYRFIEMPFRSRKWPGRAKVAAWSLGGSGAVACISLAGILSGGLGSPVGPQARAFDLERAGVIPYSRCDKLDAWCVIGNPRSKPSIMFWGDSHMISWGPAIDQELRALGYSGYFVVRSACPPVFGLASTDVPDCLDANRRLRHALSVDHGIARVVMAAHWNMYLKKDRIRSDPDRPDATDPRILLRNAIDATVTTLEADGKSVAILNSVPTYAHNVPFELARSHKNFGFANALTPTRHTFGPVLKRIATDHGGTYVDVSGAMCPAGSCETERDGRSDYHDDGHLSASGALAYAFLIREAVTGKPGISAPRQ
jgi:peptidoglycan/LPS O-acetylase OafA/YrhL